MATNLQSEAVPSAATQPAAGKRALSPDVFTLRSLFFWITVIGLTLAMFRVGGSPFLALSLPLAFAGWLVELWLRPGVASGSHPTSFGTLVPVALVVTLLSIPFALKSLPPPVTYFEGRTRNDLRMIGIALHNYLDDHNTFPPTTFVNAAGQPEHSWRATTPRGSEWQAIAALYSWNEPWDGPANSQLQDREIFVVTPYLAVDVPGGYFDSRFIVVEVPNSGINFFEPRDITLTELGMPGFQGGQRKGTHSHVLWLDGSVELVPVDQLVPRILKYMDQQRAEQVQQSRRPASGN